MNARASARQRRKQRIRKSVSGTVERPRLCVFRSLRHIYAQVIDDESHRVIAAASTLSPAVRGEVKGIKKVEQAKKIGALIASLCKGKGVAKVAFDRGGFQYHGRVKALAEAARQGGLGF